MAEQLLAVLLVAIGVTAAVIVVLLIVDVLQHRSRAALRRDARRGLSAQPMGGARLMPSSRYIEDWCDFELGATFQVMERLTSQEGVMLIVRTCGVTTPEWLRQHENALRFALGKQTNAISVVRKTGEDTAMILFRHGMKDEADAWYEREEIRRHK